MKYFNNFKIFSNSEEILFRKPSFEEIYKMIINEEKNIIINESVFRKESFNDLFKFIKNNNFKLLTTNKLKEYFPIKSKSFKILSKNKNQNLFKLYVVNDDFSNEEKVKNILLKISADKVEINEEDINLIFNSLNRARALFTPLETEKDFGILWLHKNKSTLEDFQHEFIHYLEWIDGIYASDFKLSDVEGKGMCRDNEYIDYLKRCINWRLKNKN